MARNRTVLQVTLREYLLDPTFEPPVVEYAVEENDGVHRARVAFAGVSHAGAADPHALFLSGSCSDLSFMPGAPASSQEEAKLSAALVALRSLRANPRVSEKKHGQQDTGRSLWRSCCLVCNRENRLVCSLVN